MPRGEWSTTSLVDDVAEHVSTGQGMIAVVRRTGHSSYYVEKGMGAMGKTPRQLGIEGNYRFNGGGEQLLFS